jgi:type IX secretion system PorP/SprF family membrane protein
MNMRSHIATLFCLMAVASLAQHTPITSQYLFNGLLINPAYAGSRDALTANITHRQQWVGFQGAPVTQLLSVHSPVKSKTLGLGLTVFNDRIGVSRETGVMSSYAYRIRCPQGKISLGLGLGLSATRSDWQQVSLQQGNDISFAAQERSIIRPNFSTGAYYYSKQTFIGLSVPFLLHRQLKPAEGTSPYTRGLNMQPMLFGGRLMKINSDLKLKPSMLLRYTGPSGLQGDLSANLILRDMVWLGVSYRSGDSFVSMVEVLPTPQWRIGYSYDAGLSRLQNHHAGSHELMLQYEFGYRIRVRDPRYF